MAQAVGFSCPRQNVFSVGATENEGSRTFLRGGCVRLASGNPGHLRGDSWSAKLKSVVCQRLSARGVRAKAAANQVVKDKPAAAAAEKSTPPSSTASPPLQPPAGLLDGKDPAWKLGTESKARLKEYYDSAVVPALKAEFGYNNPLEIPKIEKVVVNCGIGDASQSSKVLEAASKDLALVTGQRPVVTRSRKAIAGFKLREGVPVGMAATLRGQVMYSYLDRLLNLALPRVRDFRGVSKGGFDGRGNFSMGLAEQTMYPEIQFDKIDQTRGMDISIVTSARTDNEAQRLLELMGMPFKEGPAPAKVPKVKGRGRGGKGSGKAGKNQKQQTKAKKKK